MPTHPTSDQDEELDPLEHADQEDLEEETPPPAAEDDAHPAQPDHEAEIVAEIEKVGVEEDSAAKQKAHMIPRHLIDRELKPEDLWDEGSI